jgi:hypothetical protein
MKFSNEPKELNGLPKQGEYGRDGPKSQWFSCVEAAERPAGAVLDEVIFFLIEGCM